MKEIKTIDFYKIDEASNIIENLCNKVWSLELKIKTLYFIICLIIGLIIGWLFVWPYLCAYLICS
jgi:hypothetical protein